MQKITRESNVLITDTVQGYFDAINKGGWESYIAEDTTFRPFNNREVLGKTAYVAATKRFLQVAKSVELKQLIVDGNTAVAISRYKLHAPTGNQSVCDVAEILRVKDGKIDQSTIFFDTTAFNNFIAPFIAQYYKETL